MRTLSNDIKLTLTTTAQKLLGTNPTRTYALFVNDSVETVYLGLGKDAVANRGIRLNANGGSYEINLTNPFVGEIYGLVAANAGAVLIQEW